MPNIFEISSEYVNELVALQPMAATFLGIAGHNDQWNDFSPAGVEAGRAFCARYLERISALDDSQERWELHGRKVLMQDIEMKIASIDAGEPYRDINNIVSPVQGLREIFDMMPQATDADWLDVVARLNTLQAPIQGYIETLNVGRRRGLVAARRQVAACIDQCATHVSPDSYFNTLADTARRSGASANTLALLSGAAEAAKASYATLGTYLQDEYLADAAESDAVGPDRYKTASYSFLLTHLDFEETYRWGWDEVILLRNRMVEVAKRIDPTLSFEEVVELLETDPRFLAQSPEEFLEIMKATQADALEKLSGIHFDVPSQIEHVDVKLAPPGGALGAYYTSPSEDFSRNGCVWYSQPGKTVFPLSDEISTAYHEGFPGHHLQSGIQVCLGDSLTRAHRLAIWYSGYGEGWALYAEQFMFEEGFMDAPHHEFGMLMGQIMRACRVVIDIGMHLGFDIPQDVPFHPGEPWTFETAVELAETYSLLAPDYAVSEVTRYLGWPGQAISYKVGQKAILDIREEARQKDWFTPKEFHARVVGSGPVGLDYLREIVLG
jgi:uncharacterized protein (DUF885 family)